MGFHVLNPELARHLLEGEVDELTPQNDSLIAKIKRMPCPRCGASLHPRLNPRTFFNDQPLPRMLATCECGVELDPETGLVIDRGSAAKVKDPFPILKRDEG